VWTVNRIEFCVIRIETTANTVITGCFQPGLVIQLISISAQTPRKKGASLVLPSVLIHSVSDTAVCSHTELRI